MQATLLRPPYAVMVCKVGLVIACGLGQVYRLSAHEAAPPMSAAATRGYELLTTQAFVPDPDFDSETFEAVWQVWEEPARKAAAQASPEERRKLAFARYGLTDHPDGRPGPAQYVVNAQGNWTINCLACHQGSLNGQVIPGLANNAYAIEQIAEDMRSTKIRLGKPLARFDLGSLLMPLGGSVGTTNAVMFGVGLAHYRDEDLNFVANRPPPAMTHHDHDAPAWWLYKRKHHIYIDGFAPRHHRALMQFMMVKENGPDFFSEHEDQFKDIEAYLLSLSAPKFPGRIDQVMAARGKNVFEQTCAECHGSYGPQGAYPERLVAWEDVRTDPVRLQALSVEHRDSYRKNWIGRPVADAVVVDPGGYVAPPLDGVWATAPYFHNGSVPSLWHVLHPEARPDVWKRNDPAYDLEHLGLFIETFTEVPKKDRGTSRKRLYFNTKLFGKSAAGHDFANPLSEAERRDLLEYLKTL